MPTPIKMLQEDMEEKLKKQGKQEQEPGKQEQEKQEQEPEKQEHNEKINIT